MPDALTLEGYSVKSASLHAMNHLLFIPKNDSQSFSVSCRLDRTIPSEFTFCSVAAAYPLDPQIFLNIRIYDPQEFEELPTQIAEIVTRVRKVSYCLDVTEAVQRDAGAASNLELITDCKSEFVS